MGDGGTAQTDPWAHHRISLQSVVCTHLAWGPLTRRPIASPECALRYRGEGGIKGGRRRVDASEIKTLLCTVYSKTTHHAFCTLATQLCSDFFSTALESPTF